MALSFIEWLDKVYPDMPQWERDFAIENHRRFCVKQIIFYDLNYFPEPSKQASTPGSAPMPEFPAAEAPRKAIDNQPKPLKKGIEIL